MSSRRRKEELRAAHRAAERAEALVRHRQPHEDVGYWGAGLVLFRIVVVASFEYTVAWEVRELADGLALFRSRSPERDVRLLVGEERLSARPAALRRLVDELRSFSVPLFPAMRRFAVADGGRVELVLRSGWDTSCHLSWSDGFHPPEWSGLVARVSAMLVVLNEEFPCSASAAVATGDADGRES